MQHASYILATSADAPHGAWCRMSQGFHQFADKSGVAGPRLDGPVAVVHLAGASDSDRGKLPALGEEMDTTGVSNAASQSTENQWFQGHHRQHGDSSGANRGDWGGERDDRFTRMGGYDQDDNGSGASVSASQVMLFSLSGTFVLAQTPASSSSSQTDPTTAMTQTTSTPASSSTTTPTTSQNASSSSDAAATTDPTSTTAVQPAVTSAAPTTATTGTDAASGNSSASSGLQELNNALAALGLNQQEIGVFDQIAQLIQGISPTAFNDIAAAIEALAQQSGQAAPTTASTAQPVAAAGSQAAPTSADNSGSTASGGSAPGASSTSSTQDSTSSGSSSASAATQGASSDGSSGSPTSTVQVEEISIQFSEVQVEAQANSNNSSNGGQGSPSNSNSSSASTDSTGSSLEYVAFKLQIEEISATLSSGASQPAQSSDPSTGSSSSGSDQASQTQQTAAA